MCVYLEFLWMQVYLTWFVTMRKYCRLNLNCWEVWRNVRLNQHTELLEKFNGSEQ